MFDFLFKWRKRNKPVMRSGSGSYPYPRSHTTLMVVPSARPLLKEEKQKTRPSRKRPPLNRSCPPIPESKSNESIMSHASRVSHSDKNEPNPDCVVIENKTAVENLKRNSSEIPRPIAKMSTLRESEQTRRSTPRSPLLNVAHSVRSKLTKLTRLGRPEQTSAIRSSQSFSGTRQTKSAIPKRVDENANRVVKSSSMECAPSSSKSMEKVVIPQGKEPLDDRPEDLSQAGVAIFEMEGPRVTMSEDVLVVEETVTVATDGVVETYTKRTLETSPSCEVTVAVESPLVADHDAVGEPMDEDLDEEEALHVAERVKFCEQVQRISPLPEEESSIRESIVSEEILEVADMPYEEVPQEVPPGTVTLEEEEEYEPVDEVADNGRYPIEIRQIEEIEDNDEVERVGLHTGAMEDDTDERVLNVADVEKHDDERVEKIGNTNETEKLETELEKYLKEETDISQETTYKENKTKDKESTDDEKENTVEQMVVSREVELGSKTPKIPRKEMKQSKTIQNIDKTENLVLDLQPVRVVPMLSKVYPTDIKSPEKFILTVKTPEALRKHKGTFVIGERSPSVDEQVKEDAEVEKEKKQTKKKEIKLKKSRSLSEEPKKRFVMTLKTPEALRRHNTFVIGQGSRKTDEESALLDQRSRKAKTKEKKEQKKILRQRSQPESTEFRSPDRYVLMAKTSDALRRHHTFVIGEDGPKTDLEKVIVEQQREVKTKKKEKEKRIIRQKSEPDRIQSPERFVLLAKTPEPLRRHQKLVIGERSPSPDVPYIEEGEITEPIATVGPMAGVNRKVKEKEDKEPEDRLVMIATTPTALSKHQTFVVEDKCDSTSIGAEPVLKEDTVLHNEKSSLHIKHTKQRSLDEPIKSPERFVLSTATPMAMRKYRTFTIDDKKDSLTSPTTEIYETYAMARAKFKRSESLGRSRQKSSDDEDYSMPRRGYKPTDLYVLTATTPVVNRKNKLFCIEDNQEAPIDQRNSSSGRKSKSPGRPSRLEKIAKRERSISRERSASPVRRSLFVLGRKDIPTSSVYTVAEKQKLLQKEVCESDVKREKVVGERVKQIDPTGQSMVVEEKVLVEGTTDGKVSHKEVTVVHTLRTQTLQLESQADRDFESSTFTERKVNEETCLLTSPEEEIPMDTQQTPLDEEKDLEIVSRIISPASVATPSPSHGDDETIIRSTRPVFRAPSPPKDKFSPMTLSKSTSPIKSARPHEIIIAPGIFEEKMSGIPKMAKTGKVKTLKEKREKEDRSTTKNPLTTRSLKNAGRILTPNFLRRKNKQSSTAYLTPMTSRSLMNLPMRKAPLAVCESSVVDHSPLVENLPLTFETWNKSPNTRKRQNELTNKFVEAITEESDGNGNPSHTAEKCVNSPMLVRHENHDQEMIDDEILDQPMLMGDNFSHSESIEGLSQARRVAEFEAEKATLISIDRSVAEDHQEIPRRFDNGNVQRSPPTNGIATVYASNLTQSQKIDEGLSEVEDVRSQLEKLQALVNHELSKPFQPSYEELLRENEALRRQVLDRDEMIENLQSQLAQLQS